MKKYTSIICTMAVLLIASAVTFVSCSKDEEPTVSGKFTLTVNASKGAPATKDLSLDGTTLTASWKAGEEVTVFNVSKSAALTGKLVAQSDGVSTTLTGELTGTIEKDDELTLMFCSDSYDSQEGTLEYIAANCDYATATVTVATVADGKITTTDDADFVNQQAIVKFNLRNAGNTEDISATQLVVTVNSTNYTIIPAAEANVFFVALPGFSGESVTLTATVGGATYSSNTVSGITFVNGQYYTVTVGMKELCTYTAPTLNTTTVTYSGSAQSFVTAGSATNATIYYKVDYTNKSNQTSYGDWSTSVPSAINAGSYTVYYKVVPNDGYTGGVESTSLGTKTINRANGWCSLSPTSTSGWGLTGTRTSASATISHHGGSLSYSISKSSVSTLTASISGNTLNLSKKNSMSGTGTVTVTSAATNNYNAASVTYTCNS